MALITGNMIRFRRMVAVWCVLLLAAPLGLESATFRVASYNVENYLLVPTESRTIKSAESRAKVRESILAIQPDVIAFQEMGGPSALAELQRELKQAGLDLPHSEHVAGFDTNVHVAVLSRFPFAARRSHSREHFLLNGRRFQVSRGFAELEIRVTTNYSFTLLTAHLKSKRPVPEGEQAAMRLEEAKVLREKIDAILKRNPEANLLLLGDLNDTRDSQPVRTLVGRGRGKLVDTRPAERNGDNLPNANPAWDPRNITWTHHYGKEDAYTRIDYIMVSEGMAREWIRDETYVLAQPNWGLGSDHRPIVATFDAQDN
jgi:endonuclease/exonuclease/phosphatase family metal-dependent hydrolase